MVMTRNYCDVIRKKMQDDPELAAMVKKAREEFDEEQCEYDQMAMSAKLLKGMQELTETLGKYGNPFSTQTELERKVLAARNEP